MKKTNMLKLLQDIKKEHQRQLMEEKLKKEVWKFKQIQEYLKGLPRKQTTDSKQRIYE